jgi:hypothetical protein
VVERLPVGGELFIAPPLLKNEGEIKDSTNINGADDCSVYPHSSIKPYLRLNRRNLASYFRQLGNNYLWISTWSSNALGILDNFIAFVGGYVASEFLSKT